MKRLTVLLIVLIAAVIVILLALRHKGAVACSGVASLLPADAALLIHIPDLEADREAWHGTDLYQLYREPAMQEFLRKPKAQLPKRSDLADALRDSAILRIRDGFVATNSFDALRLVGGFEFRCGEAEARGVIERWTAEWLARGGQRSSLVYEKHAIDIFTGRRVTVSSVMVGHRFFAATTTDDLKALLDRLEGRAKSATLNSEAKFRAAMKQMPADYAGLIYLQPKSLAQKLVTLRAQDGRSLPAGQQTLIEQMQSFAHAMVFERGRLRDIDFLAMPRLSDAKLARDSLETASADTLFYLATMWNVRQQPGAMNSGNATLLSRAGIALEDWQKAFGDEISMLLEWPANARVPNAVAMLSVHDPARARQVARALATANHWVTAQRGEFDFFTAPAGQEWAMMRPVVGLSKKRLALGLEATSVERAISPPPNTNTLVASASFHDISRLVQEPQQMFAWLDLATLYSRLDSTLRPLLQLSTAFMPESSSRFDLGKLPPAEVVSRHLSPVVASQTYIDGGYRSESVGPITLGQAGVASVAVYIGSMIFGKHAAPLPGLRHTSPSSSPPAGPAATP